MKAALCKSLDGAKSLAVETLPDPVAGPGQAIVRVAAVGLNFADTLITRGKYQFKPELPFSPGAEIAGVVESIGANDAGISPVKPSWRTSIGVERPRRSPSMPINSFLFLTAWR